MILCFFVLCCSGRSFAVVSLNNLWEAGRTRARAAVAPALPEAGAHNATRGGTRLRSGLVAAQAALATSLLIGAALLLASFWRLHQVDLGFEGDQVLTAEMRLLERRYFEPGVLSRFQEDVMARVRAIPGVLEAGMTSAVPFRGTDWTIRYGAEPEDRSHVANRREVDPGYFTVMGLELLAGRFFDERDNPASERVAIVSEGAARDGFGRLDVMGELLAFEEPTRIVGVVKDVRYRGMDREPTPAVYLPRAQRPSELICLVVRAAPGANVGQAIRDAVRAVDPTVPLMDMTTVDAIVSESISDRRFYTVTTSVFSGLALLITSMGLAVVVTRSMAERKREMAIRAALGARPDQLTAMAMRQGMIPAIVGSGLGLWGGWATAGLLEQFLFEVSARDAAIYFAAGAMTAVIAGVSALLPARRFEGWSPAAVLKGE